jgi:plastocyanin
MTIAAVRAWVALLMLSAVADAAETGSVRGKITVVADGAARRDASGVVVYLTGFEEPPPSTVPELRQRGRQFQPALLAITAGQAVSFPNADPFFHNVFSLSPARRFDLGQFKLGETKAKVFPRPGVVEVYCNIHPDMAATILVLPNRRFTTTGAAGEFTIEGVPPGSWALYAYHRQTERPARVDVVVTAGEVTVAPPVTVVVDESRRLAAEKNKSGEKIAR